MKDEAREAFQKALKIEGNHIPTRDKLRKLEKLGRCD